VDTGHYDWCQDIEGSRLGRAMQRVCSCPLGPGESRGRGSRPVRSMSVIPSSRNIWVTVTVRSRHEDACGSDRGGGTG